MKYLFIKDQSGLANNWHMFCIKNLIIIKEESIIVLLIIAVEMLKIQFS